MPVPEQSTSLPRGMCSLCGRDVALRRHGELREHRVEVNLEAVCRGSGMTVDEAAAAAVEDA